MNEFLVMPADEVLLRFGAAAYGMTGRVRNVTSGFYEGVIVNEADCVIDEPCELVAFYVEVAKDDDFMLVGVMRDWLVGINVAERERQETELVAQRDYFKNGMAELQDVIDKLQFERDALNALAAQIPEIRAEAGRAGFLACIRLAHELQHPPGTIHADHYAERVKRGE